jgi:hypothetical protein
MKYSQSALCAISRKSHAIRHVTYLVWLPIFLAALAAGAMTVRAQTSADQNRRNNFPVVEGAVESVGGRLQVSLTNTDGAREFRGAAQVSIDAPGRQSEVTKFEFTLAPQESRRFPLDSQGAAGDHYTLSIHERAGTLILLKNAPINRGGDAEPAVAPPPAPTPLAATPSAPASPAPAAQTAASGLTVKARLTAGRTRPSPDAERANQSQSREDDIVVVAPAPPVANEATAPEQPSGPQVAAINKKRSAKFARRGKSDEIKPPVAQQPTSTPAGEVEKPISDDPTSIALAFDITAPSPIVNAGLSVSANGFNRRQAINIQGAGTAQFDLPDDFNSSKINYTLTDASGKTLIAGEFDFEALRMEDAVRVSEVKFDRESYSPGQSARIVMTLEGRSPYGYLLEVTAKDENGTTLIDESRKGIYSKGKSIQEFQFAIPTEATGAIGVEFKAYGILIKKLFDSGTRDVIIGDNQDNKIDN